MVEFGPNGPKAVSKFGSDCEAMHLMEAKVRILDRAGKTTTGGCGCEEVGGGARIILHAMHQLRCTPHIHAGAGKRGK